LSDLKPADVRSATHVTVDGAVERIVSKWGIDADGHLAKPSEGGFGVVTESGRRVGMFDASAYWRGDDMSDHDSITDPAVLNALRTDTCPDCRSLGLRAGPRGGAGQNIFCDACGSGFNIAYPRFIIMAQRIGARVKQ
jgi:hypothetical protein